MTEITDIAKAARSALRRERRRENEVVAAAQRAKGGAVELIKWQQPPAAQDSAAFEVFEKLRLRAEADVISDVERSRRPTWAPPMVLGEELGEACLTLEYIDGDDNLTQRLR